MSPPNRYSAYNLHKVQRWRPQTVGGPERAALCFFKYIISPPKRYIKLFNLILI
ncbi:MAG: hypothetical protein ACRC8Y_14570 [Chroococcales cyanobacterium]